ncbi:S28 family serine protease [Sorangium sp. So ce341]|uniref:S28 family serine protease n=1 Tax=Sorangium sp. So ce341 TaxID=3133302 RepID=UPI003F62FC43
MRTRYLILLAFTSATFSLVACGGDAGADPQAEGGGGAGGTDPQAEGGGGAGGTDPQAEGGGGAGGTDPQAEGGGGAGGTDPQAEGGGGAGGADPQAEGGGGAGGTDPQAEGGGGAGGADPHSSDDILDQLQTIEGLTVEELDSALPGYRYFVMEIDQPADHDEPGGARFRQRVVLHHRDPAAPVVIATEGYNLWPEYEWLDEPTELLAGNQIRVEHRFFTPSRPEFADWSQLTIEQAAADIHHVIASLRPFYEGKWISTGGSKGGMTSVYHRRFYPDDVDGTVAYVAPHSMGNPDPRYLEFLAERGDAACQGALREFQREVLLRRPAMLARMEADAAAEGFSYDLLGIEKALETAVVDSIFAFWQYMDATLCGAVPTAASDDEDVWAFLDMVSQPSFYSDASLLVYEPYYWQAAVQLGYPAIATEHLADLLVYPDADTATSFITPGPGKTPVFDPGAMQDISAWLTAEGERLMFLYGENDPYTAAAFDVGEARDTHRFVVPDGNHLSSLGDLSPPERDIAFGALASWAGVSPIDVDRARAPRMLLRGHRWVMRR